MLSFYVSDMGKTPVLDQVLIHNDTCKPKRVVTKASAWADFYLCKKIHENCKNIKIAVLDQTKFHVAQYSVFNSG